mmetsp:Transcript_20623/g.45793  ORF Transcript_20623/g.45793 Transcript_20623/m.45793 type:complete len:211 (+) Transcript_20623:3-635(+)
MLHNTFSRTHQQANQSTRAPHAAPYLHVTIPASSTHHNEAGETLGHTAQLCHPHGASLTPAHQPPGSGKRQAPASGRRQASASPQTQHRLPHRVASPEAKAIRLHLPVPSAVERQLGHGSVVGVPVAAVVVHGGSGQVRVGPGRAWSPLRGGVRPGRSVVGGVARDSGRPGLLGGGEAADKAGALDCFQRWALCSRPGWPPDEQRRGWVS